MILNVFNGYVCVFVDKNVVIVKRKIEDTRYNDTDEPKAAIKATQASITPQ